MNKFLIAAVCLMFLFLIPESGESQCAMCRAVAESGNESGANNVGGGLNTGILYLMGIPYLLLIGVGFLLFKRVRQKG